MDLGVSGLASGFDWRTLVDQLVDVERTPQQRLRVEQDTLRQQSNAYSSLKTELATLQTRVGALKEASLFASRKVVSSDVSIATASVSASAVQGAFSFNILQLAKAARWNGAADISTKLNSVNNLTGVSLSNTRLATAVSTGYFTVNGKKVEVNQGDDLQSVLDRISTATGGSVTGAYQAATDKITLTHSGGGAVVLGAAGDTSNFLTVAKLNSGNGSVTSSGVLANVRLTDTLAAANLATPISDGGSGTGEFRINGVAIQFSTSDTVADLLNRINDSSAGATASYDSANGRFVLSNKSTGDTGVLLEEVTGNFLTATGLAAGSIVRGQNLVYTVNSGGQITSASNTITDATSGITGLTVSVVKEGAVTLDVSSDRDKVKTAINDFMAAYNKVQALIESQTASSTDAAGKVKANVFTGQADVTEISRQLRQIANGVVSGLGAAQDQLADIGIEATGYSDALSITNSAAFDQALATNLTTLRELFADGTQGIATRLSGYLDGLVGESGTLATRQDRITKQISSIDTQVVDMERIVQSNREALINSFVSMEKAQARMNQQLQFLQQRFGTQ